MLPILLLDEIFGYLERSELVPLRLLNKNCASSITLIVFQKVVLSYLNYQESPGSIQRYAHLTRVFGYEPLPRIISFEDGFLQLPSLVLECQRRPRIHTLGYVLNHEEDKEDLVLGTACLRWLATLSLRVRYSRESLVNLEPLFDRLTNLHLDESSFKMSKTSYMGLQSNTLKSLEMNIHFKTRISHVLKDLEKRLPNLEKLHVYQVYDHPNTLIKYNFLTKTLYGIGLCVPYSQAIGIASDQALELFSEGSSLLEKYQDWKTAFIGLDETGFIKPLPHLSQFYYFDSHENFLNPFYVPGTWNADRVIFVAPHFEHFNAKTASFSAKEVILKLPEGSKITISLNWLINRFPNLVALEANFLSQKRSRKFKNLEVFLTCSEDVAFIQSVLAKAPKLKCLYSKLSPECSNKLKSSFPPVTFLPYTTNYFKYNHFEFNDIQV